jgi:K+-transporting ATPase ATPase A chain
MLGLTVQSLLSAATGLALLVALIRGLSRQRTDRLGSFWVDVTRSVPYILLPLSLLLALLLVSQGLVQTFVGAETAALLYPTRAVVGTAATTLTRLLPAIAKHAIFHLPGPIYNPLDSGENHICRFCARF